jgi:hypothetical protein
VRREEEGEREHPSRLMALNQSSPSRRLEPKRGTKLGELIPHLDYFDLSSWFEDWLSRASYLRGVLLVRVTAVLEQSSLGT